MSPLVTISEESVRRMAVSEPWPKIPVTIDEGVAFVLKEGHEEGVGHLAGGACIPVVEMDGKEEEDRCGAGYEAPVMKEIEDYEQKRVLFWVRLCTNRG